MKLAGQIRLPTCVDADVLAGEDLTEIDLSALEGRKLRPSSSVDLAQERIVALREQFHRIRAVQG